MSEPLPHFRYHPDPVKTGIIVESAIGCVSCGRPRGFVYTGPVYSTRRDLADRICPWCISDGSAAKDLGASFADERPLFIRNIEKSIREEVNLRTPGYVSWQQESWLCHCDDACEFHSDAGIEDVRNASIETKSDFLAEYELDDATWRLLTEEYRPGGDPAFYKFVCRHCRLVRLGYDCS